MIESAVAVDNAEKIAATDGVDLLIVGAHDLSIDLGVPGETTHARVRDAMLTVGAACRASGRALGVAGVSDPEQLADLAAQAPLRFVSAGTDVGLLATAATERVSSLRLHLDPVGGR
jgi:2-keto-3-deoxy-L-rhamnonate aldolase RhmA